MIDLVHIDDVVLAFVTAADRLIAGETQKHEKYGVSSGKPMPLKELVELYGGVIGMQLPIEWGGRPYREREVMVTCSTLSTLPEWSPKIQLEDGIRKILSPQSIPFHE